MRRDLKGDLDWIVLRAMEPDRRGRYEAVSALAADIERYLTDQPVLARPPSVAYRFKKLLRRHPARVAATMVGLIALVALGATQTVMSVRLREQRDAAREAERTANEALDFLVGMFEEADPLGEHHEPVPGEKPRGETLTAKDILERGAAAVGDRTAGRPPGACTPASRRRRGQPQSRPPRPGGAPAGEALTLRRAELGSEHELTRSSLNELASYCTRRVTTSA